jgi:hypothetical protein
MGEMSVAWKVTKFLIWLVIRFFPLALIVLGIVGGKGVLIGVGLLLAVGVYGWQIYRFVRSRRAAAQIRTQAPGSGLGRGDR